ncbi:hypothetical protein KM043_003783 [Ampulex compressa]|nr:hypothetical protein KM043_003783 [Ampulex compressa]
MHIYGGHFSAEKRWPFYRQARGDRGRAKARETRRTEWREERDIFILQEDSPRRCPGVVGNAVRHFESDPRARPVPSFGGRRWLSAERGPSLRVGGEEAASGTGKGVQKKRVGVAALSRRSRGALEARSGGSAGEGSESDRTAGQNSTVLPTEGSAARDPKGMAEGRRSGGAECRGGGVPEGWRRVGAVVASVASAADLQVSARNDGRPRGTGARATGLLGPTPPRSRISAESPRDGDPPCSRVLPRSGSSARPPILRQQVPRPIALVPVLVVAAAAAVLETRPVRLIDRGGEARRGASMPVVDLETQFQIESRRKSGAGPRTARLVVARGDAQVRPGERIVLDEHTSTSDPEARLCRE